MRREPKRRRSNKHATDQTAWWRWTIELAVKFAGYALGSAIEHLWKK
jgi:hypothetical protein